MQNELTIQNGLLLKGVRLVIPTCIRLAMLDKLHEVHQGVVRCRSLAQSSVWWPGLSRQLEELVRSCTACAVERRNPSEPMIASETVLRPWQTVGTDMFVYKKATYLLVVDYASSYVEIAESAATTSPDVILHLRSIFARPGIPETVVSDNGLQYASHEFARFASEEGFVHVTSSPRYPQSKGNAEVSGSVWCTVGIPNDITRMRILASPATDGSATENVDLCDGVDATASMGLIETTARSPRKHQDSADS